MSNLAEIIFKKEEISRNELTALSGLSAPTVLQKLKVLMNSGLIEEIGDSEPTGGRKAKLLSIVGDSKYAVGINLTKNHLEMVTTGLNGKILQQERVRLKFEPQLEFYSKLSKEVDAFILRTIPEKEKLVGVGLSLPGTMDVNSTYLRSKVFGVDYYSLVNFKNAINYPIQFDNDANMAAYSEKQYRSTTAFYLSLNNTIGGSFLVDGNLYTGTNNQSSEIGHVTLVPYGKKCYCGKQGCVDSYCSALQLDSGNLPDFFEKLASGDAKTVKKWDQYLDYLAIVIGDIRVLYDCDVILGGYVGAYLAPYLSTLMERVKKNLLLDIDATFLRCGQHKWEASAYGAALKIIHSFLSELE